MYRSPGAPRYPAERQGECDAPEGMRRLRVVVPRSGILPCRNRTGLAQPSPPLREKPCGRVRGELESEGLLVANATAYSASISGVVHEGLSFLSGTEAAACARSSSPQP